MFFRMKRSGVLQNKAGHKRGRPLLFSSIVPSAIVVSQDDSDPSPTSPMLLRNDASLDSV
mgnify:CR=1 FL=1